jgi:cytoskeletal protein CcmA (bactofilin family)
MSAIETDRLSEPRGPDLSFLERTPPRSPSIPNLNASSSENRSASRQRPDTGKVLTIGNGIHVNGEISACDTLVVEGKVSATLTHGRLLDIPPGGVFTGRAEVENAVVAGLFDGVLTVRDRLQIVANGAVKGTVRYGKLEIESGGELNGNVSAAPAHP